MRKAVIMALTAAALGTAALTVGASEIRIDPSAELITNVRAEVLRIERLSYPHVGLELRITESFRASVLNVAEGPKRVLARNHLRLRGSAVDFCDSGNIGAVAG